MKANKYLEVVSAIGLGMLVGLIIGLSASHVVGIVLGGLTTLLASFFGLTAVNEDAEKNFKLQTKPLTIAFFSISAFVFILMGLYLRTHNTLSPSLQEQKAELKVMGLSEKEIGRTLLKLRYNIAIDSQGEVSSNPEDINPVNTSLYSTSLKQADSLLSAPSYTNAQLVEIFKKDQGSEMEKYYNMISQYVKDTSAQKDILSSTVNLMKAK